MRKELKALYADVCWTKLQLDEWMAQGKPETVGKELKEAVDELFKTTTVVALENSVAQRTRHSKSLCKEMTT